MEEKLSNRLHVLVLFWANFFLFFSLLWIHFPWSPQPLRRCHCSAKTSARGRKKNEKPAREHDAQGLSDQTEIRFDPKQPIFHQVFPSTSPGLSRMILSPACPLSSPMVSPLVRPLETLSNGANEMMKSKPLITIKVISADEPGNGVWWTCNHLDQWRSAH